MTSAEKILKMIEEVNPADSDTLDEIDARFWCWRNNIEYLYIDDDYIEYQTGASLSNTLKISEIRNFRVTRSRDALKDARTEGWYFDIECIILNKEWIVDCGTNPEGCSRVMFASPNLPTEELAEFHAIVQVKQWEQDNVTKS